MENYYSIYVAVPELFVRTSSRLATMLFDTSLFHNKCQGLIGQKKTT